MDKAIETEIDNAIDYFRALLNCSKDKCDGCGYRTQKKGCQVELMKLNAKEHNTMALAALIMVRKIKVPMQGGKVK